MGLTLGKGEREHWVLFACLVCAVSGVPETTLGFRDSLEGHSGLTKLHGWYDDHSSRVAVKVSEEQKYGAASGLLIVPMVGVSPQGSSPSVVDLGLWPLQKQERLSCGPRLPRFKSCH